jgi:hypothetical protein
MGDREQEAEIDEGRKDDRPAADHGFPLLAHRRDAIANAALCHCGREPFDSPVPSSAGCGLA